MSLLTPLYLLGLLAVSLPVVFHLIRRAPKGQMPFSTLMFLSPSPPRLTRKSRIDHLLLLLLRGLILALLVLAFTRPFWRASDEADLAGEGLRRIAVLVDTSASMRRDGLWPAVKEQVDEVLDDLGPGDDVGLFAFDSDVRTLVSLGDLASADPREHAQRVRAALAGVEPTWADSDLGLALLTVAEQLNQIGGAKEATVGTTRQVVLVSDMQEGCRLDALLAYDWPGDVDLVVRRVETPNPTNAGLHLAIDRGEDAQPTDEPEIRVRVTNDRDSRAEQFALHWEGGDEAIDVDRPIGVHVPPGESRIVRVPLPADAPSATPSAPDRLVLTGDELPFDNTLYLASLRQEQITLLYLGSDAPDDAQAMRYYLERAFPETPRRKVIVVARKPDEPLVDDERPDGEKADDERADDERTDDELAKIPLITVVGSLPDERVAQLRRYMQQGGNVLFVLQDADAGPTLAGLMGRDTLAVEEAVVDEYALWGKVSLKHPLFAPFAAPQFNDFTKIHFWKYRRVTLDEAEGVEVVVRFDQGEGGDPALFEQPQGKGRLTVMTSGWHPADGQLARSSKFLPLLSGILERAGVAEATLPQYEVGDEVALALADPLADEATVRTPEGDELKLASDARAFTEADRPGIYRLIIGDRQETFAVNVAAAEGRTTPMEAEQLEQFGVRPGDRPTRIELAEQRRQMRNMELEGRQKVWRALIVAALVVLVIETWLAGRLVRRTQEQVA